MKKILLTCLMLVLMTSTFVFAFDDFPYNRLYDDGQIIDGFNYTINVNHSATSDYATNAGYASTTGESNNSQYLQGYTPITLISYLLGLDNLWTGQNTFRDGNGRLVSTNSGGAISVQTSSGQPGYLSFGNTADIGISTDGVVNGYDYDGTFITKQKASNPDGNVEFLWIEEGGDWRLALPSSSAGLGTYNPRSMIIAGPSVNNESAVNCSYWGFDNIDCTTGTTGADLGVQDDLEVLGNIYGQNGTFEYMNVTKDLYVSNSTVYIGGVSLSSLNDTITIGFDGANGSLIAGRLYGDGSGIYNINLTAVNDTAVFYQNVTFNGNTIFNGTSLHLSNVTIEGLLDLFGNLNMNGYSIINSSSIESVNLSASGFIDFTNIIRSTGVTGANPTTGVVVNATDGKSIATFAGSVGAGHVIDESGYYFISSSIESDVYDAKNPGSNNIFYINPTRNQVYVERGTVNVHNNNGSQLILTNDFGFDNSTTLESDENGNFVINTSNGNVSIHDNLNMNGYSIINSSNIGANNFTLNGTTIHDWSDIEAGLPASASFENLNVTNIFRTNNSILTGAGDQGYPAVSFENDSDTGLFSLGANWIGLSAGGVRRLDVSNFGLYLSTGARISEFSNNIASNDNASVWTTALTRQYISSLGGGNVNNNDGSTNNSIAIYDGETGTVIKNSSATITDGTIKINVTTIAAIDLYADSDNVNESDTSYIRFFNDAGNERGGIGVTGTSNDAPDGGGLSGALSNSFLIWTTKNALQLITSGNNDIVASSGGELNFHSDGLAAFKSLLNNVNISAGNDDEIFMNIAGINLLRFNSSGSIFTEKTNYELLVTEDNSIPNKKYVDDRTLDKDEVLFQAHDSTGGQNLNNATEQDVIIDTELISDNIYSLNNGIVTVSADGIYRVGYNVGANQTSSSAINIALWVAVNNVSNNQTYSTMHSYGKNGFEQGYSTASATSFLNLSSGDEVKIVGKMAGEPLEPSSLITEAYYPMNDNSVDALLDYSGNNHDLTKEGNPSFDSSAGPLGEGAWTLDGVDDYFVITDDLTILRDSFSETVWFKTTSTADDKIFSTSLGSVHLIQILNGYMRFCIGSCSLGSTRIDDGSWHFAYIVGNSTGSYLYLDDNPTPEATLAGGTGDLAGTNSTIGATTGGSNEFTGSIASFRLYNFSLSYDEAMSIYNNTDFPILPAIETMPGKSWLNLERLR